MLDTVADVVWRVDSKVVTTGNVACSLFLGRRCRMAPAVFPLPSLVAFLHATSNTMLRVWRQLKTLHQPWGGGSRYSQFVSQPSIRSAIHAGNGTFVRTRLRLVVVVVVILVWVVVVVGGVVVLAVAVAVLVVVVVVVTWTTAPSHAPFHALAPFLPVLVRRAATRTTARWPFLGTSTAPCGLGSKRSSPPRFPS